MIRSTYTNVVINGNYKVDNSNSDIIGLSIKNIGNTIIYFDGLEVNQGKSEVLIYPTNYPKNNQNIVIKFLGQGNNKAFVSIDRLNIPKQC